MIALLLAFILDVRSNPVIETEVDQIEINHYFQCGKELFTQAIYWKVDPNNGRFYSVGFSLLNTPLTASGNSVFDPASRSVLDPRYRPLKIRSRIVKESWTSTDPERDDRSKPRYQGECVFDLVNPSTKRRSIDAGED